MATLTIRQLDDETHRRLRRLAAEHGRSVEAEVRAILDESVGTNANWLLTLHRACESAGGADLQIPIRTERAKVVPW